MGIPPDALGFAVVLATLLGTAFGVKFLVWGKRPLRSLRGTADEAATDERLTDLEERVRQLSDVAMEQSRLLEEHHERLDFTERMLTRGRSEEPTAKTTTR